MTGGGGSRSRRASSVGGPTIHRNYVDVVLVVVLATFFKLPGESLGGECIFPKSWRGRWYESTASLPVVISPNDISNKGTCYDQHRDYFLVENRLEHCHQCLLIVPRHANVIQYKQSYCIGRQSLQSICAQIRVGAVFTTLVREMAVPVPCPVAQSYHFVYNNNSQCYCRSPMSYVHQCAQDSRLRFQFRQCQHCIHTVDRDVEFECLANWIDGSEYHSVGAFISMDSSGSSLPLSSSGPPSPASAAVATSSSVYADRSSNRRSYHCFMYHTYSSVMYIVMSSDTVCRGSVRSPREGLLTMELTKDVYEWPESACRFPPWLTAKSSWRSLDASVRYAVSSAGDVITRRANVSMATGYRDHVTTFRCLRATTVSKGGNSTDVTDHVAYVMAHTLHGCNASFRCLKFHHNRQVSLIQLKLGERLEDSDHVCDESTMDEEGVVWTQLIIGNDVISGPCPFTGRYTSLINEHGCRIQLQSGCPHRSRLDNMTVCDQSSNPHPHHSYMSQQQLQQLQTSSVVTSVRQHQCISWWSAQHKVYLLLAEREHQNEAPSDQMSRLPVLCYSFRNRGDTTELNREDQCDFNTTKPDQTKPIVLQSRFDACSTVDTDERNSKNIDDDDDLSSNVDVEDRTEDLFVHDEVSHADRSHRHKTGSNGADSDDDYDNVGDVVERKPGNTRVGSSSNKQRDVTANMKTSGGVKLDKLSAIRSSGCRTTDSIAPWWLLFVAVAIASQCTVIISRTTNTTAILPETADRRSLLFDYVIFRLRRERHLVRRTAQVSGEGSLTYVRVALLDFRSSETMPSENRDTAKGSRVAM